MSVPKLQNQVVQPSRTARSSKPAQPKARQGELELTFDTPTAAAPMDAHELVLKFLKELRLMCQLIEEAGRYGTTTAMERKYRTLRTNLAKGYRSVKDEFGIELFPSASFHGSSFEMIFTFYSLDSLVRGPGMRTVERLAEIWRTAQSVKLPDRSASHSHS